MGLPARSLPTTRHRRVNFDHIKQHYYYSHESINPTRIVPKGPEMEFSTPHDRERFSQA